MSAIQGNPEADFKEQNPVLGALEPFTKLYKKHGKETASKIIWSMYMLEDTDQKANPIARLPSLELRLKEVKDNYYDIDIESEEYKDLANYYSRYILTKEENLFKIQSDKFEEMIARMKDLDLENSKEFNTFMSYMSKIDKLWDGYDKVKERLEKSQQTNVRGNAKLSKRQRRNGR